MGARFAVFLASWCLLCSRPAWAQQPPQQELAERLRGILRQYESNIAGLKSRIAELETRLSESEARSTSLLEDLRASRQALSSLTLQYGLLETRLAEYQTQLEASRLRTESSLDSLTASMASMRARSFAHGSALALLVGAAALLLAR